MGVGLGVGMGATLNTACITVLSQSVYPTFVSWNSIFNRLLIPAEAFDPVFFLLYNPLKSLLGKNKKNSHTTKPKWSSFSDERKYSVTFPLCVLHLSQQSAHTPSSDHQPTFISALVCHTNGSICSCNWQIPRVHLILPPVFYFILISTVS